jgi:hypothetical protein
MFETAIKLAIAALRTPLSLKKLYDKRQTYAQHWLIEKENQKIREMFHCYYFLKILINHKRISHGL